MNDILWHIIVNPAAHHGAARRHWPEVEAVLQEMGFAYTVHFTTARGHASQIAETVILEGGRYILGMGGDGTNHEIVNGIMRQDRVPTTEVHYALLPFGTGNDWARMYDIPHDVRQRLTRLRALHCVRQDVGVVDYTRDGQRQSRFFVNVAGMAYDGFICQKLETQPAGSKAQYLLRVARHLFEYRLRPAVLYFDGKRVDERFYTINVGLCKYSGGGMQLVPQAVPDDGLFALTFARQLSKAQVLLQTPRFYNGTLLSHPLVEGYQAKSIRVEHAPGAPPTLLEADGEFLGETPVEFRLLEGALVVVV
jgi:diacylglycerol kinase (ATP)